MLVSGTRRGAIFAASLMVLSGVAAADNNRHGWYLGFDAGASFVNDMDIESTPNSYSFDMGWGVLGTVGYAFDDPDLRFEFEAGIRHNNIGERNGLSVANGELREITGFANLLWDGRSDNSNWGFTLGVGAGIDNARFKDHLGVDSRDVVPAAQGIVGLNYRLNDDWDYSLTYRVLYADVGEYDTTSGGVVLSGESDAIKHLITLGFKYGYDEPVAAPAPAAPPPAPPPAAPPPPKQFIVFFGFNKANLTAEAQAVVAEAAAAAKAGGAARIAVVGHTDTAGSPAYNESLSLRRASAVKDELIRLGVSSDAISASGKGESELMVQSGDGVKEPQNRRATIDLN
jgi:outer membrane protein OmpA-like peptidoglycan-associated protein